MLCVNKNIHDDLFQFIKNGLCSQLETQLHHLSNHSQYLQILRTEDQEQISLLMLAASYGYDDIVSMLLTFDNTIDHVELKGRITVSDGISINGATALYCACYNGYFT